MDLYNFDLDQVEEALKDDKRHNKQKKQQSNQDDNNLQSQNYNKNEEGDRDKKKSKKKDRSRSRSHSKKHKKKKHSSSRSKSKSRNKDKDNNNKKKIENSKSQDRQQQMMQKNMVGDFGEEREHEFDDQKRDDLTVLVLQLPLKALEKDIYKFFLQANCGKIRDIRLIRDPKFGKSKGVAYVEFYDSESVFKAVQLNGTKMMNHFLLIQPSFAEKNRVHQSVKSYKLSKDSEANKANKIYISGLNDQLADIQEDDLQDIFAPFGEIEFIDLRRDPKTQKSLGFALIQYRSQKDAKAALESMDGFKINGKAIQVNDKPTQLQFNMIQEAQQQAPSLVPQQQRDLDYEDGSSFLHNSQSRYLLMQKLTRSEQPGNAQDQQQQQQQQQQLQENFMFGSSDFSSTIIPPSATAGSITVIGGKKIIPEANVYIKNLDPSVSTNQLESVFSMYGPILSCKIAADPMGNSLGYAYVQYENKESADLAIKTASGTKLKGTVIQVQPFISKINRIDSRNNLYVKNLPNNLTDDEMRVKLEEVFGKFGRISSSIVKFDAQVGRPFAFICYEDHEAAQMSFQTLNGQDPFQIGMGLYISWAEKKPERVQRLTDQYSKTLFDSVISGMPGVGQNLLNPLAMQGLGAAAIPGMTMMQNTLLNMQQFQK